MNHPGSDRLPPALRALVADVMQPPAGESEKARIARGERAFAMKTATWKLEEQNDRQRLGLGLTPRSERS